ncbi:hypothetical protein F5Y17DRAFT_461321 [Xylariaceae sp. FL0594]|nr:hypothetical protein F5Y17DRAFT_461321 [Xylariaceae sp. FL0594]
MEVISDHAPLIFKNETAPLEWKSEDECPAVSPEIARVSPSPEARLSSPPNNTCVPNNEAWSTNITVELPLSTLTEPASLFEGFIPPAAEEREWRAVAALLDVVSTDHEVSEGDFVEFELDKFSFFVRRVPFEKFPVKNYGESHHSVEDQIWILSDLNEKNGREVYYKLRSPATDYRRFHEPYLWVADLTKHVIDFCEYCKGRGQRVGLQDFKLLFSDWSVRQHQDSKAFRRWHKANRSTDFRGANVANIEYIWKEAHDVDPTLTSWHPVWRETKSLDYYAPNLSLQASPQVVPRTKVTPYIHTLFSHMVFGQLLESTEVCAAAEAKQTKFTQDLSSSHTPFRSSKRGGNMMVEKGDVISTLPDDDSVTQWKQAASKHAEGPYVWFGLVQKVHARPSRPRSFDVLWLYQPIDTPCSVMKYPWKNELFLSDNCTYHHHTARVREDQVLAVHEVEFFGTPTTSAEYFVRQTYVASDCRWASLRKEHFMCGNENAFSQGSDSHESGKQFVRLRRLVPRKGVDMHAAHAAPLNELVYSQQFVEIAAKRIDRRCLVRAVGLGEEILPPYNRNGTGDAFYVTHEEVCADGVMKLQPIEPTRVKQEGLFRQGFDPNKAVQKLHGLDLFCGGGNFGRGIEEGGAVEMRWANDIWKGAIHSYMANSDPAGVCTPFLGSIDDLLHLALEGDQKVPSPGEVHFISAGSPCPGFSSLAVDKTTDAQRKNQSLVASFASFVDLYRLLYGVLENVPTMVSGLRDSCVFSQLVCALVSLGYQIQVMFLDAWAFGSSQNRSRVFIASTAPGLPTPKAPQPSHSHPEEVQYQKLGVMSCGRPFDSRKQVPTPFKFTPFGDDVGDLPNIQDGKADYCVGYPDHRLSIGYTPIIRKRLQQIPTHPYGMNFSKAWFGGVMTDSQRQLFPAASKSRVQKHSKGWGRVHPRKLINTVSTKCSPSDARVGRTNYWEQDRPITVLEARRAQGFLDSDVLVGTTADQFKIIGNSVCKIILDGRTWYLSAIWGTAGL